MYCILRPCFHKSLKSLSRIKLKHVLIAFGVLFVLDFFGAFTHFFEVTFDENFSYPYDGDVHEFVAALRYHRKPEVPPINVYNYTFVHEIKEKCLDSERSGLRVVFLVKSAIENFERRMAIRNSWGFEKRFSDVACRTVFILGVHPGDSELREKVDMEAAKYKDIVQADFIDTYYNNTIKTMMAFKWAIGNCLNSKFYMFVDDDMYVSMKNVLRFVRNPALYPDYLKDAIKFKDLTHLRGRFKRSTAKEKLAMRAKPGWTNHNKTMFPLESNETTIKARKKRQSFEDFELPNDVRLFAGFVIVSAPHRHKTSKWYVSLNEYPYHLWPPYITAGAYIMSKNALLDMYYTSMYTKHFRFDDIFLGLTAKKADIEPFHCEEFHFYKKDYAKYNYKYVISSHGYGNPEELLSIWHEQKSMGNA